MTDHLKEILKNPEDLEDPSKHIHIYFDLNRLIPIENGQISSGGTSHTISRKISMSIVLHEYFIEINRPIPRFIIIDQFSQGSSGGSEDDIKTIKSYLEIIYNVTGIQIILLEHINYENDMKFCEKVIERWKTNKSGLLPQSWINNYNSKNS